MTVTVRSTRYGAPAYRALAEVVRDAKGGDPLAPVMLIVPGERVGIAARRALARGLTPNTPGIAALRVVTLRRFAEILAGDTLTRTGRRPITGPVLIGAIRSVLAESPGIFAPVVQHVGTARALVEAHRKLRPLSEPVLDELATQGTVVTDTVRLHRSLEQRLAVRTFDEVDLLDTATRAVQQCGVPERVVLFLPQDLDAPEIALLAAIAQLSELHVVVGFTGDPTADEGPLAACRALGVEPQIGETPTTGDTVVHASDPDDEVRGVVRRVVAALAERPGHRVSVLYGSADPYARLLHEHLGRAGVTLFGRGMRPTAEGRYGRAVLRLLALPDHDFRRDEVLAFVADAPVRHRGAPTPSSAWERISRAAGVVRGDDWARVQTLADERETWIADNSDDDEWRLDRARREADTAHALHAFVNDLRAQLTSMAEASTWRELGDAALQLWSTTLNGDDIDGLAPEEQRAAERIMQTLTSLAGLDDVAGPADLMLLRQLVELELTDDLDRVGRIGVGVHVGPISEGIGENVDVVFIVGAAEGVLPSRIGDDPLLPDRVRALTDGALPTRAQRLARQHRHVLAALAAAPEGGRVFSFPRGDLRLGGSRVPSRWLLPTLRAMAGRADLQATEWEQVDGLHELPSYAGALERSTTPANEQEWRQRAAVDRRDDAPDDPVLARARVAHVARLSTDFTVFDGNLAGEDLPDPTGGHAISATALERWVHCPHGYFMRHLLRITPVEQPEDVVRISAPDRGTVLHDVLERLVQRAVDGGWAPGPDEPWPDEAHEVLSEAAHKRFAQAEAEGVTGFALLWEQDREALRADLFEWIAHDNQRRRAHGGLVPVAAEWAFSSVEIPLGDGRTLRMRGKIDRIDRVPDGRLVVTDYKSGKPDAYSALDKDPCDRGQRLQLPVYALAARAAFGSDDTTVCSEYWFTSRRGQFKRIGYLVDDHVLEQTRTALRTAVDGISRGMFLARPKGKGNVVYDCPGCDPDGLGEHGVADGWRRKGGAPEPTALRSLLGEEVRP
jgi:RecB family exonuclease